MHSTSIFNFFMLVVAASAAATSKAADSKALQKAAEGKFDIGNTACCNNVHEEKDDRLFNLVKQGLIHILAGKEDYACAKSSDIDERNLFSLVKQTNDGPVCKHVTTCCPDGNCVAIDDSTEKDKKNVNENVNEDDKEDNKEDNKEDSEKDKRGDHDYYHHKGHKVDKDDKENKHEKDEKDHDRY